MNHLDTVLACLKTLDAPASISAAKSALAARGTSLSKPEILEAIGKLVGRGQIWEHPPASSKGSARYWVVPPADFAGNLVLKKVETLGRGRPVPMASLKAKAPKPYSGYADEARGALIEAGKLFEFRVQGTSYVATREPSVRDFLTPAQLKTLNQCVDRLRDAGRAELTFEALLAFLDGSEPTPEPESRPKFAEPTEQLLGEWFRQDLPSLGGLRTMPFTKTWRRYVEWSQSQNLEPHLEAFHDLLSDMASRSLLALTPHDEPGRLPAEEQLLLLLTPDGSRLYYYTILS